MNIINVCLPIFLLLLISCGGHHQIHNNDDRVSQSDMAQAKDQIIRNMEHQETSWNQGDIDGYMAHYWNDPKLSFVGATKVSYGWSQVLANYKKGYPDRATMGKLSFDIIELNPLSPTAYHMIGKFTLTRSDDAPSGHFTLIWKLINGKWLIVSDHTSG